jgi:hypothetical protein
MLLIFGTIQSGTCQTTQEQAQTLIGNAEGEIRGATDDLLVYWNNISDSTRYNALIDIQKAWQYRSAARGSYDIGSYNESLEEAYWATFVARRVTYRIFLDIANTSIREANSTLRSIPSYIPQPTEATEKLAQAYNKFKAAFLEDILDLLPSTEIAPSWITAMHNAEDALYWDHENNVVVLANQALKEAVAWETSHEESLKQVIGEQIVGVSNDFYIQLLVPFTLGMVASLFLLVPMTRRFKGWAKKKSNRNVIWDGNLWSKKLDTGSIVSTLGALTGYGAFLWGWLDSFRALSRTYEIQIPVNYINIINPMLLVLIGLLSVLWSVFAVNRLKWQKKTGMLFAVVLIIELVVALATLCLGWFSIGQIHHAALA